MANSVLINIPLKHENLGFGDYSIPEGKSFEQMQAAAKLQTIVLAILFGILAVGSIALIQISFPLAVAVAVGFSLLMIKSIVEAMGIGNRAPPMGNLFPAEKIDRLPQLAEISDIPCTGFPTQDGPDSQVWKEELIRSARSSIVLSGCYCGGRVFDRTLDLIERQMDLFPHLKTSILSSEIFISQENTEHLNNLKAKFPDRFTCIVTPELFPYISPTTEKLSATSNHTKALIIDYGAYFMVGGSGIVSVFAEQQGELPPEDLEPKVGFVDNALDLILKMRAFRDMDFVFRSEMNGVGTRLYVEMMKLFERMRFRQDGYMETPDSDWPEQIAPTSERFAQMASKVDGLRVTCYASGPEQEHNAFLAEMIEEVDKAEESIGIDNLYFHPPEELLQALIRASNRGVKIAIVTNKSESESPGSHSLYTERSSYHARRLFEGRHKPNIELHEYAIPFTSLHKKVMTIDGKITFSGSANMGKKSLENHDYEINLKIISKAFAKQVNCAIDKDKALCRQIPAEDAFQIPLFTPFFSTIQAVPMYIA